MKLKSIILIMLSILILSLGGCGSTNSTVKNSNIEKEKVVETVKNSFEKYFDAKLDTKEIIDNTKYINSNGYWITILRDNKSNVEYYSSLRNDGKLDSISCKNIKESSLVIDQEESKKIAAAFIRQHFSHNNEDIKFIRVGQSGDFDFTYGKDEKNGGDKVIYINIDSENKKVCGFTLNSLIYIFNLLFYTFITRNKL